MTIELLLCLMATFTLSLAALLGLIWKRTKEAKELQRTGQYKTNFLVTLLYLRKLPRKDEVIKDIARGYKEVQASSWLRKVILLLLFIIFPVLYVFGLYFSIPKPIL